MRKPSNFDSFRLKFHRKYHKITFTVCKICLFVVFANLASLLLSLILMLMDLNTSVLNLSIKMNVHTNMNVKSF